MTTATTTSRPPAPADRLPFWLIGFVLLQFACQAALLFESLGAVRVAFRIAAFAASLAALGLVPGRARQHPSRPFLWAVLAIVAFELFHPNTNTPLAAIAQFTLYLAVAAPVVWVARMPVDRRGLAAVLAILWGFHTLSAIVGVLQSLFPGRLQPAVSTIVLDQGEYAEGLRMTLADGSTIWRPMGLTDQPGGAAAAGMYAVIFGMGFVAISPRWHVRLLGLGSMAVGLYCIYLAQIRAALVVGGLAAVVFLAALAALRRTGDAVRLLVGFVMVIAISFVAALTVGGSAVSGRLATLVEESPDTVYYQNRGRFLEETVTHTVPEYPIGAGLGRWGMTRRYFADLNDPRSDALWAEIQWTAWVLDGGLPLVLAYTAALVVAFWAMARAAVDSPDPWLAGWAALLVAYAVAVLASTFSYVPFIGQAGMEFWLLSTAVWTAVRNARPRGGHGP